VHAKCMAVKTITIDMAAYEALVRHKREGESFSRVIKSHFGRKRTGRDLEAVLEQVRLSEKTIDGIEAVVKARRRSPARAAKL
jgi:predicted CopG family antitoxin